MSWSGSVSDMDKWARAHNTTSVSHQDSEGLPLDGQPHSSKRQKTGDAGSSAGGGSIRTTRQSSPPSQQGTPPLSGASGALASSALSAPRSANSPPASTPNMVDAGYIPDNLIFGHYSPSNCTVKDALSKIFPMNRAKAAILAVQLQLFGDVAEIDAGISVHQLKQLIFLATGKVDNIEYDAASETFNFEGLVIGRPHFRQPAAE